MLVNIDGEGDVLAVRPLRLTSLTLSHTVRQCLDVGCWIVALQLPRRKAACQHNVRRRTVQEIEGRMPTVLRRGPYRFFFYAGDRNEPPHVHVERENNTAKFWLDPVRLQQSGGFSRTEINRIQKLVEKNREHLLRSWDEHFHD